MLQWNPGFILLALQHMLRTNSFHCLPAMATVESGAGPNPVGCLMQVHNEWHNIKKTPEVLISEMSQCNPGFILALQIPYGLISSIVCLPASHGHC